MHSPNPPALPRPRRRTPLRPLPGSVLGVRWLRLQHGHFGWVEAIGSGLVPVGPAAEDVKREAVPLDFFAVVRAWSLDFAAPHPPNPQFGCEPNELEGGCGIGSRSREGPGRTRPDIAGRNATRIQR